MNYLDALAQLDTAAQHLAQTMVEPNWRLHVQPRSPSGLGPCVVELQHWGDKGYWFTVANVSCEVRAALGNLQLQTFISCTMCGRWSTENPKARGLQKLFAIADMFEEFAAGRVFEA